MADPTGFLQQVAAENLHSHAAQTFQVVLHGQRLLPGVPLQERGADGAGIHDHIIEQVNAGVVMNRGDVVRRGELGGLSRLPHEVDEAGLHCPAPGDGLGDALDQQVGDDAGEQGAGAERDGVGFGDGLQGLRERDAARRIEPDSADAGAGSADAGFAGHDAAVLQIRFESHVGGRGGVDVALDGQHLRGDAHGAGEIARDVGERGQKEVAETVALQAATAGEAVAEQTRKQGFVFRERHHAVANIARWEHLEIAPQTARAAAVIAHGDDGGEIDDWKLRQQRGGIAARGGAGENFEATEQGREARAAADEDDSQRSFALFGQRQFGGHDVRPLRRRRPWLALGVRCRRGSVPPLRSLRQ